MDCILNFNFMGIMFILFLILILIPIMYGIFVIFECIFYILKMSDIFFKKEDKSDSDGDSEEDNNDNEDDEDSIYVDRYL